MRGLAALAVLGALGGAACGVPKHSAPALGLEQAPALAQYEGASGESYTPRSDNPVVATATAPVSTFSIDVDTASYANVRRFLRDGALPPRDAVRAEELINAFSYRYQVPRPGADEPIALTTELAASPFHPAQRLVRIGLATAPIAAEDAPPRNLVFLIDTSGSMTDANKLPLLLAGLRLLVANLRSIDHVGIVAYAGSAGVVLEPTAGDHKSEILAALEQLQAGGSTNGGAGIEAAYRLAQASFRKGGINRVILCTDGDFNVGVASQDALIELISARRQSGVYLTVMGFGAGNLKDSTMESLAQHGNGNYGYVDTLAEARKLLVEQAGSTLLTVAKDVKIQVAFEPARVAAYRLIGYENRLLAERDFTDDSKDAGEIGAGHRVTALYEVQLTDEAARAPAGGELLTVRVRYKREQAATSLELATAVTDARRSFAEASPDLRLAAALAGFAMLLRGAGSELRGDVDYRWARDTVAAVVGQGRARDEVRNEVSNEVRNEREELVALIEQAARLSGQGAAPSVTLAR